MSLQPFQDEYPDSQFQCVNVRYAVSGIYLYDHFMFHVTEDKTQPLF